MDWLNAGNGIDQKKKEELARSRIRHHQYRDSEKRLQRFFQQNVRRLSNEIVDLMRDIGRHKWGKGILFAKYNVKHRFLSIGYEWTVTSTWCAGDGYAVYLISQANPNSDLLSDAPKVEDFFFVCNDKKIALREANLDNLRGLLRDLYQSGPNFKYNDCDPGGG